MIGDKLVITEYHRSAAAMIFKELKNILADADKPVAVTVAGESGCGKSETAAVLAELCNEAGYKALILQQDDYFVYPPKTNHSKREEDINWVGPQEVKINLIEENIDTIKNSSEPVITKPLVNYDEDSVDNKKISVEGIKVVVVEGTYTTTIRNADLKAFIDRDYRQTKKARLKRSRDPQTDFLEQVLSIEHNIISAHKIMADVIIPAPEEERNSSI
ncbi:MAG: zeta toxin family protein [Bacillota bacterium]